ncbi:SphA family protein [Azotobacter vinelandii]
MNNLVDRAAISCIGILVSVFMAQPANATEGGGNSQPLGAEQHMLGALPPPGLYLQVFSQHYEAQRMVGNDGRSLLKDFHLRADAITPRVVWITNKQILGGALGFHMLMPFVNLHVKANGASQVDNGQGDATMGTVLGYHWSERFHSAFALDVVVPTGRYDKHRLANVGRNYWAVVPVVALTYEDPKGLNADVKFMYDMNFKNPATDYRSGHEFHFDYDLGWG